MLLRPPVFRKSPYISSLISWGSTHRFRCLKPGSPRSRNETRTWMQVVHFGGADVGEWGRQGGKEASTGSVNEQATAAGAWGSVLLGTSGRWHRTCCAGDTPGGLILYFLPSLAEGCCRYHSLQTAPGARHDKARSRREAGPCRRMVWAMEWAKLPTVSALRGRGARQFSLQK